MVDRRWRLGNLDAVAQVRSGLKKLRGSISLATEPGAEFFVDGKLFGTTPIRRPIELDAGPHTLAIKKPGFFTWTQEVKVEAKQTLSLKITLSRQY